MAKDFHIMIVEDSPEDYEVLSRAIKKAEMPAQMTHCFTGEEAIQLLTHLSSSSDSYDLHDTTLPDIILLDLNLPGTDGYGVLEFVKARNDIAYIPVIVFSTSTNPTDIKKSYKMGANSYIPKPQDLKSYKEMALHFKGYWMDCVFLYK